MATDNLITLEDYKALESELHLREGEMRNEINERIRVAREFGDLSENAEHDAAKEEQGVNEDRIREIHKILTTSKVVDMSNVKESDLTAAVGTEVELEGAGGRHITFSLVGTTNTDSLANKISNESPVGAALVGHRVGDEISFATPSGKLATYRIVHIRVAKSTDSN